MQHLDNIIWVKFLWKYSKNVIWMLMGFWLTRRLSSENKSWRSLKDSVNDKKVKPRQIFYQVIKLKKYLRRENLQVVVTVHPQVAVHEGRQISYDSFIIYVLFCDNLNITSIFKCSNRYTLGENCPDPKDNNFFSALTSF